MRSSPAQLRSCLEGSAADLASAMTNLSEDDYDYNVSITTAHNATQLATINNASQGDIIFTGSNNAIELTGTATVVSQALAGLDYAGNVILTEGSATTTEINTINTATTGTINGLALTSITGVASAIETSLGYLNTKPQEATAIVSGTADAQDIIDLDALEFIDSVDGTSLTRIDGTAESSCCY